MIERINTIGTGLRKSIVEILHNRGLDSGNIVIIIVAILVIDMILLHRLHTAKNKYLQNQEDGTGEDNERYVEYYKKKQYINTIRGIMRAVLIISFILYHNPNIFAGLAIAIGAFVISFGSVFVSLGVYLYLLSFYSPGNYVKVGDITGEIVSITPLYLKLLERNESGDHTGEFISIPNHKVWQNNIALVDLDLASIQKSIMEIGYDYERYHVSFDEFVEKLKKFLDDTFPINTIKTADHYKSYKGYKYKLSFSMDKEGKSIISLGFLSKRSKTPDYKYQIVAFLESLQKQARQYEKQQAKKKTTKDTSIDNKETPSSPSYQTPVGSTNVI